MKRMARFALAAATLALCAGSTTTTGEDGKKIEIFSDGMTVAPNTHAVNAVGHVYAKGAKFDVHCDAGETTYEQDETGKRHVKTMYLHGHVHIRRFSDGMVSDSDVATYESATEIVTLLGDPVATRNSDILRGVRMDVSTDDDSVDVTQPRVELIRLHKDTVHVTAERLFISDDGKNMHFEHNVHVQQPRFLSHSDVLDAIVDPDAPPGETSEVKRLIFIGHVKADRPNQTGTCGKAIYDPARDDLLMEDHPVVIQDGDTLRGHTITINNTTGVATAEGADMDVPPEEGGDR